MRTVILFLLLVGSAYANPLNPFRLGPQEEAELQAYLEHLRVERDAGKITQEQMRYLYIKRENDMKNGRLDSFRANRKQPLDCTRTSTGMRCE